MKNRMDFIGACVIAGMMVLYAVLFVIFLGQVARHLPALPMSNTVEVYKLSRTASLVAGKQVRVVCAQSDAEWEQMKSANGLKQPGRVYGFAYAGNTTAYIEYPVCSAMRSALVTGPRRVNMTQLAWGVDVLTHESTHLRGVKDEATTEACARKYLARSLNSLYRISYGTPLMRDLTSRAARVRGTMPTEYQGGHCDL